MADDTDYMGEAEPAAPEAEAAAPEQEQDQGSPKTAILPRDFFQGGEPQPGDTCEVKIEAVHDSQIEVSYHSSETSKEEATETQTGMEAGEEAPAPDMMEA